MTTASVSFPAAEALVYHAHDLGLTGSPGNSISPMDGSVALPRGAPPRRRGELLRDLPFHGRFVARALDAMRRQATGADLRVGALLVVWQVANAAGFLTESLRGTPDDRSG